MKQYRCDIGAVMMISLDGVLLYHAEDVVGMLEHDNDVIGDALVCLLCYGVVMINL